MAAFAGLFHLDHAPLDAGLMRALLGTLAHRGADAQGTWAEGPAGLAARFDRLTPQSLHADAVARTPEGRFVCAADARLDARAPLLHLLGLPADASDGLLIAHAVARWGADAPRHLTGDFAYAVWDAGARRLYCARDRMGVKPFYYLHEPGRRFACASETRALRTLPGFTARLDESHLADTLLGTLSHDATFFQSVRRLPAGTALTIDEKSAAGPVSYWALDPHTELHLPSDQAYADAFLEHFQQAVRDRMASLHPVGAALSGGLDSSSIAVLARETSAAAALPVFSAQFAGLPETLLPMIDERPYVQAVVRSGGFSLHVVEGTEIGPFTDFETMSWHLEDIFRTINLYLHWGLFGAARAAGVRVFLDGTDGDTVVSHGFDRLSALALRGPWAEFAREVRAFPDASTQRWFALHYGVEPLAQALRQGRLWHAARGGLWMRRAFGLAGRRILGAYVQPLRHGVARREALAEAFVRPDFDRRNGAWERHRAAQPAFLPSARAAHARGIRSPLFPHILEMADRTAAAFDIEPRYPFFDHRLIAFCVSLPAAQKLGGGLARRVMRNALAGRLPEAVRLRTTKANLKPAFDLALARAAPVEVEPYLFASDLAVAPFIEVDRVRAAYSVFMRDPLRHSALGTQLYAIAMLERGLRRLDLNGA